MQAIINQLIDITLASFPASSLNAYINHTRQKHTFCLPWVG